MFAFIGMNANADEKILECTGNSKTEGMNIPPHAKFLISDGRNDGEQKFILNDDSIAIVGEKLNLTFKLCSKSSTEYIYSSNCAVKDLREMALDWTKEDDPLSKESNFQKKWLPNLDSVLGAELIHLDRVNLIVTDDNYNFYPSTDDDKKGRPILKRKNYTVITHSKFQCKIAKQKI